MTSISKEKGRNSAMSMSSICTKRCFYCHHEVGGMLLLLITARRSKIQNTKGKNKRARYTFCSNNSEGNKYCSYHNECNSQRKVRGSTVGRLNAEKQQFLKKNQSTPRPSEHPPVMGGKMSKRLGEIKGCKYKISSWHLDRFPDADNIGSTV